MGIKGLLTLLKSIQRPTELKKFAGETLGVDAYGWLHRGAIACAIELAEGKPTRKYIDFVMHRVRMAKHFGVTPYLVFDGDLLPSKAITEASRAKRRDETRKAGFELLKAGKPSQAHLELQKAIDVTPEMARQLIEELKKAGVPYIVAPYEADAQLVYLERQGIISGIITEDSDLLVFGAKRLLTKMDQYGQCIEINRRDFCACREVSLTGWTDTQFRQMAILSGCDYLDGINSMGLKTAHRMIRKHKTAERVIRMLQFDGKFRVPEDYAKLFRQAELTFLYQWAYDPTTKQLTHLTPLPSNIKAEEMPFIGGFVAAELAEAIALGDVNPMTKEKILISALPEPRKRTASTTTPRGTLHANQRQREPPPKPIESYFQGHRRIPLGEMEANCFSIDPERVARITEEGARPIVYPLPRPYLDESIVPSGNSRTYVNQSNNGSRALRRRTEPVSNLLSNDGRTLASGPRRQTLGPRVAAGSAFTDRPTTSGAMAPPLKKARLCEDGDAEATQEKSRSKFFQPKMSKLSSSSRDQDYIFSDDSVEQALNELPDVEGWQPSHGKRKSITVFEENSQQTSSNPVESSIENANSSQMTNHSDNNDNPDKSSSRGVPSQSILGQFAYPGRDARKHRSGQNRLSTSSMADSILSLTPGSTTRHSRLSLSSFSPGEVSTAPTTPASPRLTPLQQIGARALNKGQTPPSSVRPAQKKRTSHGRPSLDSIPINPSFVPLPRVTMDEVEALHKPVGSEDQLVPDSEHEDPMDETENINQAQSRKEAGGARLNLSRFLFS